jgi:hypothetical protein
MDELNNFKKLLNDIKEGNPEDQNIDIQPVKSRNKGPFINKKSVGKPVLKVVPPKWNHQVVKPMSNTLWADNKEVALFSLLASVVLSIVGIISAVDYLILVGAIGFLLAVIVIFLLMFNYATSAKKDGPSSDGLEMRIEELSQRIESMGAGDYSANTFSMSDEKVQEMEGKIEELRTIVKPLLKAMGNIPR